MKTPLLPTLIIFMLPFLVFGQDYPEILVNGIKPGDKALKKITNPSKPGEITIISFNVRDVQGKDRTLEDYRQLAELMKPADIVVFQELGAKGYFTTDEERHKEMKDRFIAMIAVYKSYLGADWEFVLANEPTPESLGGGAEVPLLGYRTRVNDLTVHAGWLGYHDLGPKRDMGLFQITCSSSGQAVEFTIGTVHTTPNCDKGRPEQLIEIGKYAEDHVNDGFILMGDFNFGYASSCEDGYRGEDYLRKVDQDKHAFLVFDDFSYDGNGDEDDFRTNLDRRGSPHMYDQFLVSNSLAGLMADGGSLGEDCGWISFDEADYFEDMMEAEAAVQIKGFKKAMTHYGHSTTNREGKKLIGDTEKEIANHYTSVDVASHHLSDHKPIWLQLKLF